MGYIFEELRHVSTGKLRRDTVWIEIHRIPIGTFSWATFLKNFDMFQRESWGGILYDDWSNAFPEQTTWWTTWVLFSPIFDGKNTYMKPHGLPVKISPNHSIELSQVAKVWSGLWILLVLNLFFLLPQKRNFLKNSAAASPAVKLGNPTQKFRPFPERFFHLVTTSENQFLGFDTWKMRIYPAW